MTNKEKSQLKWMAKQGMKIADIRCISSASDATIRRYLKLFKPKDSK